MAWQWNKHLSNEFWTQAYGDGSGVWSPAASAWYSQNNFGYHGVFLSIPDPSTTIWYKNWTSGIYPSAARLTISGGEIGHKYTLQFYDDQKSRWLFQDSNYYSGNTTTFSLSAYEHITKLFISPNAAPSASQFAITNIELKYFRGWKSYLRNPNNFTKSLWQASANSPYGRTTYGTWVPSALSGAGAFISEFDGTDQTVEVAPLGNWHFGFRPIAVRVYYISLSGGHPIADYEEHQYSRMSLIGKSNNNEFPEQYWRSQETLYETGRIVRTTFDAKESYSGRLAPSGDIDNLEFYVYQNYGYKDYEQYYVTDIQFFEGTSSSSSSYSSSSSTSCEGTVAPSGIWKDFTTWEIEDNPSNAVSLDASGATFTIPITASTGITKIRKKFSFEDFGSDVTLKWRFSFTRPVSGGNTFTVSFHEHLDSSDPDGDIIQFYHQVTQPYYSFGSWKYKPDTNYNRIYQQIATSDRTLHVTNSVSTLYNYYPLPLSASEYSIWFKLEFSTLTASASVYGYSDANYQNQLFRYGCAKLARRLQYMTILCNGNTNTYTGGIFRYDSFALSGTFCEGGSISSSSSSSSSSESSSSSSSSSSESSSSSSSSSSVSSSSSSTSCFVTPDDDFTGTNGNPANIHRWSEFSSGVGTYPTIQSNALLCDLSGGQGSEGITSNFKLEGDFDVQVYWIIGTGGNSGINGWSGQLITRFAGDDNNRAKMRIDGWSTTYIANSVSGGVPSSDSIAITSDINGQFRITRVGSTFNCYYYNSGWVLLHSATIGTSACEVQLSVENFGSYPDCGIIFDTFTVTYDDIDCAESVSSSSSSSSESSSSSVSSSSVSSSSISSSSLSSSSQSSSSSSFHGGGLIQETTYSYYDKWDGAPYEAINRNKWDIIDTYQNRYSERSLNPNRTNELSISRSPIKDGAASVSLDSTGNNLMISVTNKGPYFVDIKVMSRAILNGTFDTFVRLYPYGLAYPTPAFSDSFNYGFGAYSINTGNWIATTKEGTGQWRHWFYRASDGYYNVYDSSNSSYFGIRMKIQNVGDENPTGDGYINISDWTSTIWNHDYSPYRAWLRGYDFNAYMGHGIKLFVWVQVAPTKASGHDINDPNSLYGDRDWQTSTEPVEVRCEFNDSLSFYKGTYKYGTNYVSLTGVDQILYPFDEYSSTSSSSSSTTNVSFDSYLTDWDLLTGSWEASPPVSANAIYSGAWKSASYNELTTNFQAVRLRYNHANKSGFRPSWVRVTYTLSNPTTASNQIRIELFDEYTNQTTDYYRLITSNESAPNAGKLKCVFSASDEQGDIDRIELLRKSPTFWVTDIEFGGSYSSSSTSSSSSSQSSSSSSSSESSSSSSNSSSSSSFSASSSSNSSSSSSSSESVSSSSRSSSSRSSSESSSSSSFSSSSSSSFFDASRIHFWHYVVNSEGQPIQNAEIRFYLKGTTTEANIYLTEVSSTYTTTSIADIKTDEDGFFEFWIANEWEAGGYSHEQQFRLEWYAVGTVPEVIKNINPWENAFAFESVNTGTDVNFKNKYISNKLAKDRYDHTNELVPSASPHDLYPVDVTETDNRYNKVVSNKLLNTIFTNSELASAETLSSGRVVEYQYNITAWSTSSSVYYRDISHNLGNRNITVQLVKSSNLEKIEPKMIQPLNINTVRVVVEEDTGMNINVQGSSSSSSSSESSSSESSSSFSSSSSSSYSGSSSSSSCAPIFQQNYWNSDWGASIMVDPSGGILLHDSATFVNDPDGGGVISNPEEMWLFEPIPPASGVGHATYLRTISTPTGYRYSDGYNKTYKPKWKKGSNDTFIIGLDYYAWQYKMRYLEINYYTGAVTKSMDLVCGPPDYGFYPSNMMFLDYNPVDGYIYGLLDFTSDYRQRVIRWDYNTGAQTILYRPTVGGVLLASGHIDGFVYNDKIYIHDVDTWTAGLYYFDLNYHGGATSNWEASGSIIGFTEVFLSGVCYDDTRDLLFTMCTDPIPDDVIKVYSGISTTPASCSDL